MFSREEAERRAKSEKNAVVLDMPEYEPPTMSCSAVRSVFNNTRDAFLVMKERQPTSEDDAIRQQLCGESGQFNEFSETHPTFFSLATNSETTEATLDAVSKMIDLRQRHENSSKSEQEKAQEVIDFMTKYKEHLV